MSEKLYARRDPEAQGEFYMRHLSAMTAEGLHNKAEIACELAHRDEVIHELLAACKAWVDYFDERDRDDDPGVILAAVRNQFHRKRVEQTRAAIAKAEGRDTEGEGR